MSEFAGAAARGTLGVLARTWQVEVVGGAHLAAARAGGAFAFALWHRLLLPLLWWHRAQHITLLVSQHRDGELLSRAAAGLGYAFVRGSSRRGGTGALRGLVGALARGEIIAVTPDGPRGPAGVVKPGVVAAARCSGVPILPVAAAADRAWQARSWDRLLVPRPFARVRVAYGPPLECAELALEAACRLLGERLEAVTRTAEAAA